MFRRALGSNACARLSMLAKSSRNYTNYDHHKYPVYNTAVISIVGYFLAVWILFARLGSLLSYRSEYKKDYLRIWRRKLGTGYEWSDAWGPQMDTVFKNLPEAVE